MPLLFLALLCVKTFVATLQFELAITYLLKIFSNTMTQKENGYYYPTQSQEISIVGNAMQGLPIDPIMITF